MHYFVTRHLDDIYILTNGEAHDITLRVCCLSPFVDPLQSYDFI